MASGQPATVFTDGTFTPADWQSATFVAQGTTSMAFDQVAAGNPEPGRRMTFSVTSVDAGATVINRSGAVNVVFSYDPSVQGAIQGIVVSFDLAVLTSTFPGARSGGYTPMLVQGGIAYAMSGGASAGSTAWVGFTRSSTDASQWVGGGFNPDFSASGGVIRFGYQTTFTLSCDLQVNCGPATVTSALDNYRVAIESVPVTNAGIPEPSTLALSGGALLLVAVGSGRRSASPTDRTTS
ncbi:MAG: hypothetical protein JNK87_19360 [Bryobacterales bacterium]|nr:hypothetical protein [Bryobacterales bacterium]